MQPVVVEADFAKGGGEAGFLEGSGEGFELLEEGGRAGGVGGEGAGGAGVHADGCVAEAGFLVGETGRG